MKRPREEPDEAVPDDGDEEGDSLEDLFGPLEGDSAEAGGGGGEGATAAAAEPAAASTAAPGPAAFRAAFRRIDSIKEQSAQQFQDACALLGGRPREPTLPRAPSPSPSPGAGPRAPAAGAGPDVAPSWLEWVEEANGAKKLTLACVRAALDKLKRDASARFPLQDVTRLLWAGIRGSIASPTAIREVAIPAGSGSGGRGRVLIVGDTHGQLEDVLWIFFKHGEPCSKQNVCIFNGDIADRGRNAVEILMLVIMYSLADPGSVYLNRGNHEDSFLTSMYGFREECLEKYGRDGGRQVHDLARELFNTLALGCTVDAGPDRRLFVVHGGLPRNGAALEEIRTVNFRREVPAPPQPGQDEVFFDCLWADPQEKDGVGPNIRGPHVVSFGPDITASFLRASGVDLVVRSHAVPRDGRGVEWHHGGKVLTVFSASNYCGSACNMGGVAAVRRGQPIETFEHWAGSRAELVQLEERVKHASEKLRMEAAHIAERRRTRRSRAEGLEKIQRETLEHVKERVVSSKGELREFWAAKDEDSDFHVTLQIWRDGMAKLLGEDMPWDWVAEQLEVVSQASGRVPYTRFLQRFRLAQADPANPQGGWKRRLVPGWQAVVMRRVFESLLGADLALKDVLAAMDRNADGVVGATELLAITSDCGMQLTLPQCETMVRTFAGEKANARGEVKLFDLLDSMTAAFSATRRPAATDLEGWVPKRLRSIREVLVADARANMDAHGQDPAMSSTAPVVPQLPVQAAAGREADAGRSPVAHLLCEWFRKADADRDGYLSAAELERALERLAPELEAKGVPSDAAARATIVGYIAWREEDRVNFMELLAAMAPCGDGQEVVGLLGEDPAETVALAIYAGRASLLCTLRERFDPEGTGRVSVAQFAEGLAAVNPSALPRAKGGGPMPAHGVEAIVSELADTTGPLEYEAFIGSFHIVEGLGYTLGRSLSFGGPDDGLPRTESLG